MEGSASNSEGRAEERLRSLEVRFKICKNSFPSTPSAVGRAYSESVANDGSASQRGGRPKSPRTHLQPRKLTKLGSTTREEVSLLNCIVRQRNSPDTDWR